MNRARNPRRTGVSPVYGNIGVQFIEPAFSGRINPLS